MGKEIFQSLDYGFASKLATNLFNINKVYESDEVIYTDRRNFSDKYIGKKILVVGGGPTSVTYDWNQIDYDYIWSLNRFYQNTQLFNTKLDLIHFGTLVPFDDVNLRNYLDILGSESSIYFEANHIREDVWSYLQSSDFMSLYGDRSDFYMTKFKGVMGAANRLVLLAAFMGASDVYFAGVDGFTKDNRRLHAFWDSGHNNTTNVPGQHVKSGGDAVYGYDDFKEGYKHYVDYLNQIKKSIGTNFHNLGEGHESNIIGLEFAKELPLSPHLKNQ